MSLMHTIAEIWEGSKLNAMLPVARVFTGRVPQTEQYRFPYVSVLKTSATPIQRTDKTQRAYVTIAFHIWLDEADLARGEHIALAIEDVYPERCWTYDPGRRVIDCLDEGPATDKQIDLATYKVWEVVKLVTLVVERDRTDHACCDGSDSSFDESSGYDSGA